MSPKASKSFTISAFLIFLMMLLLGITLIQVSKFANTPIITGQTVLIYEMKPGSNVRELARSLNRLGYLSHPQYLVWLAHSKNLAHKLKNGEYQFKSGTTPLQLLQQIAAGKVMQHSITFVEGWRFEEIKSAIRAETKLKPTIINLPDDQLMAELGYPRLVPEGEFFPDTYYFPKGTTDKKILLMAIQKMQQQLLQMWSLRAKDLPYRTSYDALIAASLIEKESALPEERSLIASVLINRLKRNMRLQFDPTVIYGLGPTYKGKLLSSDLRTDTPYNTYTRSGLPPTPIAMPSAMSIFAALHPATTEYLYFVARGPKKHKFSVTLEEHNMAVKEYRKNVLHEE